MSRFLLQRKLMTFADRYSIRDEQGEDAYLARGQWMSIGKKIHVSVIELLVSALIESISDLLHQIVIEVKVVQNRKSHTESLTRLEKMAYV